MSEAIPTERELQALKVLWQGGPLTVRQLWQAINDSGEQLAYTTVLSLLQVMEHKGLVGHRANGKVYTYFPKVERQRTLARLAHGFLDRVFDGAMDQYVLHALDAKRFSEAELARLEQLVAEARRQSGRQGKESSR